MNKTFEELTPWLDKIYALNCALVLFEWDDATEAPEESSELTSKAVEILSSEYFKAIINDDVKKLLEKLSEEKDLDV